MELARHVSSGMFLTSVLTSDPGWRADTQNENAAEPSREMWAEATEAGNLQTETGCSIPWLPYKWIYSQRDA